MSSYYQNYLASKHWRTRTKNFWNKHKRICRNCGEPAQILHHVTYRNLYHEPDSDLWPLCKYCHYEIHYEYDYY